MLTKNGRFTKISVNISVIAIVALLGSNAYAAGAVSPLDWNSLDNSLDGVSSTITASDNANKGSMASNPALKGSAWAHTGRWFNFYNNLGGSTVNVKVTGVSDDTGNSLTPGLTVWASGSTPFDGGTEAWNSEVSLANGFGVPHSFNVTGALNTGNAGTDWMATGQGGNMIETLGYAVSNPDVNVLPATSGWGETILGGVHDVSVSDTFESGISGSTTTSMAELQFNSLATGWYTVYVGGTDQSAEGFTGGFDLVVSAVPEAETWAMLLAGLGLIGWRLRKQQPTDEFDMPAV